MKISPIKIPFVVKIFFVTILVALVVGIINVLIPDYYKNDKGDVCGVISLGTLSSIIFIFGTLLTFLLSVVELIHRIKNHQPLSNFISFILLLSIILFVIFLGLISVNTARIKSRYACTMSGVAQSRVAQELFYDENGRYASTLEELFGSNYSRLINCFTGKELTDRDGVGIEGGDNDPNTWEVAAFIPQKEFGSWCKIKTGGYWYYCNQTGYCGVAK